MEKRVNKKKVMSICPSKMVRSKCPSIRRTRQLRRELLMKQREKNISEETLDKLREKLRAKKIKGISVDCEKCPHNTQKNENMIVNK